MQSVFKYICILSILSFANILFAATLIYPGSFDLFHATHDQELSQTMNLIDANHVIILPIEKAYYNQHFGLDQPSFFPYEWRSELIKYNYLNQPQITVSDALRNIKVNSIQSLIHFILTIKDTDKYVLIGTDVLVNWEKDPLLNELLKKIKLIVSLDPQTPVLNTHFQNKFIDSKQIVFTKYRVDGIRSLKIAQGLFAGSRESLQSLPPRIQQKITAELQLIHEFGQTYRKNLAHYLKQIAKIEFSELLKNNKQNISEPAYRILQKAQDNLYLMLLLLPDLKDKSAELQGLFASNDQILFNIGELKLDPNILKEIREFLLLPSIAESELMKGLRYGRDYIWPNMTAWDWSGVYAPELSDGVEIRETPKGKTLWVLFETKWYNIATIQTLPKGTQLYHWSPQEYANEWSQQGKISLDEMFWRLLFQKGLVKGGLYVSLDPVDSKHYGVAGNVFETTQDILLANYNASVPSFFDSHYRENPLYEMGLLSAGIGAARGFGMPKTWMSIKDIYAVQWRSPIQLRCAGIFL